MAISRNLIGPIRSRVAKAIRGNARSLQQLKKLLLQDDLLSEIIFKDDVIEVLLKDGVLSEIILKDDVIEVLLKDGVLSEIIIEDDVVEVLLKDGVLSEIILKDDVIEVLLKDGVLSDIILKDDVIEVLLKDGVLNNILVKDLVMNQVLAYEQVMTSILANPRILAAAPYDRGLAARIEFEWKWQQLSRVLSTENAELLQRLKAERAALKDKDEVIDRLLNVAYSKSDLCLSYGTMKLPDRRSAWTLINEIFINEDYYFETDTDTPRILDCGTHVGLAIYYFKNLYPKSRLTGFEPVPQLREIAQQNITRNGFESVEILPYALSESDGLQRFYVSNTDSMASTLTSRRLAMGDELSEIQVQCRRLSEYLHEPIHFLKIDLEGSESVVLNEAKELLGNVQFIFCEYHHGAGQGADRLNVIIKILSEAGFDLRLSEAYSYNRHHARRSMISISRPYSIAIWASNRRWC